MKDDKWVDDSNIERYAGRRLQPSFKREHLDDCPSCAARVAEFQQWIEKLRRSLPALQETRSPGRIMTGVAPAQNEGLSNLNGNAARVEPLDREAPTRFCLPEQDRAGIARELGIGHGEFK